VHQVPAVEVVVGLRGEPRHRAAEGVQTAVAEGQRTDRRVEPVRPHDQAEALRGCLLERHVDAVRVLVQRGDGVAKPVFDACRGGPVQHVREVVAQHLDLGDDALAVERVDGHAGGHPTLRRDPRDAALVERDTADAVHEAHPLDHRAARSAQVDGLPARPYGRGALDHRDVVPRRLQPVRQRGPCDARSGDENVCHAGESTTYAAVMHAFSQLKWAAVLVRKIPHPRLFGGVRRRRLRYCATARVLVHRRSA
jgi:hypothetical protein